MGTCGKPYVNDKYLAGEYIIECSRHLHPNSCLFNLWGKRLAKQIMEYSEKARK